MEEVIDVVIPTYNRAKILAERLPSYWSQSLVGKIFVVDSGESTETEEMIKDIQKKSPKPIIYFRFSERKMQQVCKNYGVEQSDADYIFIGEDDLLLPDNHLNVLLSVIKREGIDVVGGRRVYIKDGQSMDDALKNSYKPGKIFYKYPFEAYFEEYFPGDFEVPYLHSNVLAKRDVFKEIKYDDRYKGNAFREELDFYLSCRRNNKKMFFTSKTACFHLKSERKKGTGSQIQRLKYEFYVWINTIKCFYKNRDILKRDFSFNFPVIDSFFIILARYTNALWRRIRKKY